MNPLVGKEKRKIEQTRVEGWTKARSMGVGRFQEGGREVWVRVSVGDKGQLGQGNEGKCTPQVVHMVLSCGLGVAKYEGLSFFGECIIIPIEPRCSVCIAFVLRG